MAKMGRIKKYNQYIKPLQTPILVGNKKAAIADIKAGNAIINHKIIVALVSNISLGLSFNCFLFENA
jgi:hypothetical protein